MKFIILGSGGCVCTPKPLCQCAVCAQARQKGYPYARCGCSLYLEDIGLMVDTPEDSAAALNNADIRRVDHILYSHWDPDHTLGMRIVEQLRLEWLAYYQGQKPQSPIGVYAQTEVMGDLNKIRSPYGPFMDYYEHMGLIKRHPAEGAVEIGGIRINFLSVPKKKAVTVFVFEKEGKRLVYAPCDCVPFPEDPMLYGADVLVMGNVFIGPVLKNQHTVPPGHPLRKELHSFEEVLQIREKLRIPRLYVTHIEEDWGKSYDDYRQMEKELDQVRFAFDGLVIDV